MVLTVLLAFLWIPHWWWHPLTGLGYQWWSGIGSDLGEYAIASSIFASAYGAYRRHNCHVQGCWRTQWKAHGTDMLCKHHHPSDSPKASDIKP